jgi:hypothetical protein
MYQLLLSKGFFGFPWDFLSAPKIVAKPVKKDDFTSVKSKNSKFTEKARVTSPPAKKNRLFSRFHPGCPYSGGWNL